MHGGHALIETVAALVLTLGGAAIVVRAWLVRARSIAEPTGADTALGPSRELPSDAALVALLSCAAGAIHLAAGPEHVETLGDIGLGFYWAAVFQLGFGAAWLVTSRQARLAWAGIVVNAVLIGVWAWSRTVGFAFLPDGPEPVGLADALTMAIEAGLIATLVTRVVRPSRISAARRSGLPVTSAAVAIAGIAVLATAIAIADLGHGHHDATTYTAHVIAP